MKNSYLVTGIAGYIGNEFLKDERACRIVGIYHNQEPQRLRNVIYIKADIADGIDFVSDKSDCFDTVIHTAAITHIDKCEEDKKNAENGVVWKSNVVGTKKVVDFCRKYNKKLVLLSTECIFDGKKSSFNEDDIPNPINWYGRTKLEAERIVINSGLNYLIIRSVVAYGGENANDIFHKMNNQLILGKKLLAVNNQRMNPTYVKDIIDSIFILLKNQARGIYHVSGPSIITPYNLALKIAKITKNDLSKVEGVPLKEFFSDGGYEYRLKNSVLDTKKYTTEIGKSTTAIDDGLKMILKTAHKQKANRKGMMCT